MKTDQVDVLKLKAAQLLKDLVDVNLMAIKQTNNAGFMELVERLRAKAELLQTPTLEEITMEVEAVRTERFISSK